MPNIDDLIEKEVGVRCAPVVDPLGVGTIGTTVERILPNNPRRIAWTMVNLSTNIVYVNFTNDVSATNGFRIAPAGGALQMHWKEDFHPVSWSWYAVASGAASAVLIYTLEIE